MRHALIGLLLVGCSGSAFEQQLQDADASDGSVVQTDAAEQPPDATDAGHVDSDAQKDGATPRDAAEDRVDACTPKACEVGRDCGKIDNGCGAQMDCGDTCAAPKTCGALAPNVCSCKAKRCSDVANSCGSMPDGCNGFVPCGDCAGLQGCGEGGKANICGTFYEQCSTTNFAGSQCVIVNGQPNQYRYCPPALLTQFGQRHRCITWSANVCADASGQWRCDF
jgi:hypothetical protein